MYSHNAQKAGNGRGGETEDTGLVETTVKKANRDLEAVLRSTRGGNPGKNLRRRHFFFSPPPIFLLWRCPKLGWCRHGRAKKNLLDLQSPEEAKSADPFFTTVPSSSPSSPQRPSALPPEAPPPLLFLPACQANGRGGGRRRSCGNLSSPPSPFLPRAGRNKKSSSRQRGRGGHQQPPRHLEKLCPETVQCEAEAQPFSRNLEQEEEAAR